MTGPVVRKCSRCDRPMDPAYRPFCPKPGAGVGLHEWPAGG